MSHPPAPLSSLALILRLLPSENQTLLCTVAHMWVFGSSPSYIVAQKTKVAFPGAHSSRRKTWAEPLLLLCPVRTPHIVFASVPKRGI